MPIALAILLFGSLLLWYRKQRSFRGLGFPKDSLWLLKVALSTTAGIVIAFFFIGLFSLTGLMKIEPDQEYLSIQNVLVFVIIVPALTASSEEVIFRGVFFQVLRGPTTMVLATVLAAALWALFHLPGMHSEGLPPLHILLGMITFIAWGCTLTFSYLLSGKSLWVPIGIHFGYNLMSSLFGLFYSSTISGYLVLTGFAPWVPETGIAGAVFWLLLALLLGLLTLVLTRAERHE